METMQTPNLMEKLARADLKEATRLMSPQEARYLVDTYYMMQDDRKRANSQSRECDQNKEPNILLNWLGQEATLVERQLKTALDLYTDHHEIGRWAKKVKGIGPVISAGLMAHIDIEKSPTVGHIWSFAGLNPERKWLSSDKTKQIIAEEMKQPGAKLDDSLVMRVAMRLNRTPELLVAQAYNDKGKITKESLHAAAAKRPWNAQLKTLTWHIGQCFMKVKNRDGAFYGQEYAKRKELEIFRNEGGQFAAQAERTLKEKRFDKKTDAYGYYSKGLLPPAHIDARARRYAVKLFLAHWHEKAYLFHYGEMPPAPYPIAILGHGHYIPADAGVKQ